MDNFKPLVGCVYPLSMTITLHSDFKCDNGGYKIGITRVASQKFICLGPTCRSIESKYMGLRLWPLYFTKFL